MIEEDAVEQERQRLLPFFNFRRITTAVSNSGVTVDERANIDWYEDAFNDAIINEMDDNNEWLNVDILDFGYSKRVDDVPVSLFNGSSHTARDLARFILSFKSHNLKVGDYIIAEIVGMFASFLPTGIFNKLFYNVTLYL
jgi:hypothetical protein